MNLVVCNMSNALDWEEGIVNRNFFIVRELARAGIFEKILLVDFLAINPVGLVFGKRRTARYAYRVLATNKQGSVVKRFGASHVLRKYGAPSQWESKSELFLLGGVGFPQTYQSSRSVMRQAMQTLSFSPQNTVVWSYNAFAPELLDIDASHKVFDAVDNWSQHASYGQYVERLQENYRLIGAKADTIFTVSDGLRALFPAQKTHWIPNGVDLAVFAGSAAAQLPAPDDIAALAGPIIGYVGTVQERLDFDLLTHLLQAFPQFQFVFVGPVWSGVQSQVDALVKQFSNVRFLGRRPYTEIPKYLACMDVAIIPHRIDAFIQSTNPMKLYDYLAAGKAIVTTPGAGTEAFKEVVHIAQTPQAFRDAVLASLKENDAASLQKRKQAILAHTWKARVDEMRTRLGHDIINDNT